MTAQKNLWGLRHRVTGKFYPNFTYKSRESARAAAKGRRFSGMYIPDKVTVQKTVKYKMKAVKPVMTLNKKMKRTGLSGNLPSRGIGGFAIAKSWPINSKKFNRTLNSR